MSNETNPMMNDTSFGAAALAKLKGQVSANFRIYSAGVVGGKGLHDWTHMSVVGAEFRVAKRGPDKGKLTVLVPGTSRRLKLTKEEVRAAAKAQQEAKDQAAKALA